MESACAAYEKITKNNFELHEFNFKGYLEHFRTFYSSQGKRKTLREVRVSKYQLRDVN